jgi:hypothetical protein
MIVLMPAARVGHTDGYARAATPVTSAHLEGLDPGGSILDGGEMITAEVEEIVDRTLAGSRWQF